MWAKLQELLEWVVKVVVLMEVVREADMEEVDTEVVLLQCLPKEGTNKEAISLAHTLVISQAHTQGTNRVHTLELSLVHILGIILLRSSHIPRDHSLPHTVAYLAIVVGIRKLF